MKNSKNLLINNLSVSVFDTPVIKSLSLSVERGKIHALMGPNGSGKSTLAYALMGHPNYSVTGSIFLKEDNITHLSPDKRAQKGLFLSFQHPYEIPGVSVFSFLKEAYSAIVETDISTEKFNALLCKKMEVLEVDQSFASRGLNEGFSGGEKKRLELLQLLLLQPKIAILDEIDSGLDIDALKIVARGIELAKEENPDMSIIVITHYQRILQYIKPDTIHILCDGNIVTSGDKTVAQIVEKKGYDVFRKTT